MAWMCIEDGEIMDFLKDYLGLYIGDYYSQSRLLFPRLTSFLRRIACSGACTKPLHNLLLTC